MFQIITTSFTKQSKRYLLTSSRRNNILYNNIKYFSTNSNDSNDTSTTSTTSTTNENTENNNDKPKTLEEINLNLEKQLKEMRDKVIRAYADEENVRRIAKRDVENARVYANTKFAKALLDVADNLERALAAANGEVSDDKKALKLLVEGVDMTHTQLKKVFEQHGVIKVFYLLIY